MCDAPADIYQLSAADFHDVTSGFNGFSAGPGYDLVTGRGTPVANRLLPDLIGSAGVQAIEKAAERNVATASRGALGTLAASARHLVSRMVVSADLLPPPLAESLAKLRLLEGW